MICIVAPEFTSPSWYCLGPKLDKSRNSSSCRGGCSPGLPLLEKSRVGVRGWVTALVFPHCSVIFLHFPGQPAALCTRHWPSACVQTGTLLNVDKSSWWDRNWANGHKESAPSKKKACVCVWTCAIRGCLLLPWRSWRLSWWHAYTKTQLHTLSSFWVIRQIKLIDC